MSDSRCIYFHRTAVVMADGQVTTCANMYAEHVGYCQTARNFWHRLINTIRVNTPTGFSVTRPTPGNLLKQVLE